MTWNITLEKDHITILGSEVSRKCVGQTHSKTQKDNRLSRNSQLNRERTFSQEDGSERQDGGN